MNRHFSANAITSLTRRSLMRTGVTGAAIGAAALAMPTLALAHQDGDEGNAVNEIHELQANFHLAKSTQDIDLMMSLWADDATFTFHGVTYVGSDQIRAVFLGGGSFTHLRLSLVSSFKIQIEVDGREAYLYFECIDIGDFATNPAVASVLFNAGTVKKVHGKWVFWDMHGGPALPLSVDHYYYP